MIEKGLSSEVRKVTPSNFKRFLFMLENPSSIAHIPALNYDAVLNSAESSYLPSPAKSKFSFERTRLFLVPCYLHQRNIH